jgi:hypothetical protein
VQPQFSLKREILAIADNLRLSAMFLLAARYVWLGLIVLVFFSFAGRRQPRGTTPGAACLVLWCIGTCIAFHAVHVEGRYLMPFAGICFALGYSETTRHLDPQSYRALLATLLAALLIPATEDIVAIKAQLRQGLGQARPGYFQVARDMRAKGLRSGGKIAVVGFASDAYYAKAAGAQILAQIPDEKSFWQMTDEEMNEVRNRLRQLGITMIVAPAQPPGQGYSIFPLD